MPDIHMPHNIQEEFVKALAGAIESKSHVLFVSVDDEGKSTMLTTYSSENVQLLLVELLTITADSEELIKPEEN